MQSMLWLRIFWGSYRCPRWRLQMLYHNKCTTFGSTAVWWAKYVYIEFLEAHQTTGDSLINAGRYPYTWTNKTRRTRSTKTNQLYVKKNKRRRKRNVPIPCLHWVRTHYYNKKRSIRPSQIPFCKHLWPYVMLADCFPARTTTVNTRLPALVYL